MAEIFQGVLALPVGKRRRGLLEAADYVLTSLPVLDFDYDAALAYATIHAERVVLGQPISAFDAQIAAIARVNEATLFTRNIRDFDHLGLDLVDPFS